MAEKRFALGRGLSALIPEAAAPPPVPLRERAFKNDPAAPSAVEEPVSSGAAAPVSGSVERRAGKPIELDIDRLVPNARQPRTHMDDAKLEELAQSIRANGVIQPIIVRIVGEPAGDGPAYEIVAGERRWRAAQRAGLLKVPVVMRDVDDSKLLEIALIENIQRENLNPIEEAQAYRRLSDEVHLSQEAIATAVGKDRATVANYIRLLRLPAEIRSEVASGALSMGHARALLSLPDEAAQRRVGRDVVARALSVRETETLVRQQVEPHAPKPEPKRVDANTRAAQEQLKLALGTDVRIHRRGKGGRIDIAFKNEDELQRVFELLTEK